MKETEKKEGTIEGMDKTTAPFLHRFNCVRKMIHDKGLKKNGQGRFVYFNLEDFMPAILEYNFEYGLYSMLDHSDIQNGIAKLLIYDAFNQAQPPLVFTIPITQLTALKGDPMQQIGGMVTYARRYLYMTAYEICESDTKDYMTSNNKNRESLMAELVALNMDIEGYCKQRKIKDMSECSDTELIEAVEGMKAYYNEHPNERPQTAPAF